MSGKCGKCGTPVKNGHNAKTCGKNSSTAQSLSRRTKITQDKTSLPEDKPLRIIEIYEKFQQTALLGQDKNSTSLSSEPTEEELFSHYDKKGIPHPTTHATNVLLSETRSKAIDENAQKMSLSREEYLKYVSNNLTRMANSGQLTINVSQEVLEKILETEIFKTGDETEGKSQQWDKDLTHEYLMGADKAPTYAYLCPQDEEYLSSHARQYNRVKNYYGEIRVVLKKKILENGCAISFGDYEAVNAADTEAETPSKSPHDAANLAMPIETNDRGEIINVSQLSYTFGQGVFRYFPDEYVTKDGENPDTRLHETGLFDLGVEYAEIHVHKRLTIEDIDHVILPHNSVTNKLVELAKQKNIRLETVDSMEEKAKIRQENIRKQKERKEQRSFQASLDELDRVSFGNKPAQKRVPLRPYAPPRKSTSNPFAS